MVDNMQNTENIKTINIDSEDALNICIDFYETNSDDDATTDIILAIFSQLFDCSIDTLMTIIENERKSELFCYKFNYFFNRKESGSCAVILPYELPDTDDINACIDIALKENTLDKYYADNIISIEKMNKEDAEYWKAEYRRKKSAK